VCAAFDTGAPENAVLDRRDDQPRPHAPSNACLEHIQLSFQDSMRRMSDCLSSTRIFELKSRVTELIRKYRVPMVLNVVLHRLKFARVEQILVMAEKMEIETLELANTQYYGWAWLNRAQLRPSQEPLRQAEEAVACFRTRVGARMRLFSVVPDYFETGPKPCMNGLGSVLLTIAPDAWRCHAPLRGCCPG
jgi:pyrroloquinoline quinone biosynthesis protein E